MQAAATGLLALMAGLYVVAEMLARRYLAAGYLRAFAEAAVVGGCADWFAVTALFRRPLGLPIPHTGLIPRSKARIGAALGRFIVENFLDPRVLDARLKALELATWGGRWLQAPANARTVAAHLVRLIPKFARALPEQALEDLAAAVARPLARAVPAAPTAAVVLSAVWDRGRAQPLIDRGAELLADYLASHQEVILEKVQGQSWRWLPDFVDRAVARRITLGLVQLLTDVRDPEHPWRGRLHEAVLRLVDRLANDSEARRQGEVLKQRLLDDPRTAEQVRRLWGDMRRRLQTPDRDGAQALESRLAVLLGELGGWLARDPAIQRALNGAARTVVRTGLVPRREAIGRFVAQVVESWDARDVVERLELQVGPDLQYIRINGALVGGLVGLLLYSLTRALSW